MSEGRRPYDSTLRRTQMAERRERILDAACELVHEFQSWDWRPLTFRAVSERSGVSQRTVYRHFATEQALHEAVMQRLGRDSGVVYEGLSLADVSEIGARVFASYSTFAVPAWAEPDDEVFVAEDDRRKAALLAAVRAVQPDRADDELRLAAAALDVLWLIPSYQRLVSGWKLPPGEAAEVIDWLIQLVVDALEAGKGVKGHKD